MTAIIVLASFINGISLQAYDVVVADSITHIPLPNATIYDKHGTAIGMSNNKGVLPKISSIFYPITLRYLGFYDKTVFKENPDTIFLSENISELPEVIIETRQHRLLHILAYIREYSTLSTYTDTVFLFREKMVDYMLPSDGKVKFKGWSTPRILTCKSYYRFTDNNGLDSVSDVSRHHFSWSDWIGLAPETVMPLKLRENEIATDTLYGKYSPSEIWSRQNDRISIYVDILADTTRRKWVPDLNGFFRENLDFERFKINYRYNNVAGITLSALDLDGYSYNIESNGRGHNMFQFNRRDEPFFVSTQADVYILDKEYIPVKEAKKWDKREFDIDEIGIYEPMDAPPLSSSTLELIYRVNNLDKDRVRLDFVPDYRLMSIYDRERNFKIGRRALFLLKQLTGITLYKSHKNFNNDWKKFRNERKQKNKP